MERCLDGRPVVVTGAGKGLGRAYAEHAAECGAPVVVNDVDAAAAQDVVAAVTAAGGRAVADVSDVSDPAGAAALIARSVSEFGSLWGLVNNAGIYFEADLWDYDLARMRRLLEVNVFGTMYCSIEATRVMRAQGRGGAIVNAGSLGSTGSDNAAAYATSKGAVTSFSTSCAIELEPLGIRVNTIWPSALTPMVAGMVASSNRIEVKGLDQPATTRLNRPADVAPLVSYLLSDRAEGIAGQAFHFDGKTLGVVVHVPLPETPGVRHEDGWDVSSIAKVIDTELLAHLQPYGPRGRVRAPRVRPGGPS